MFWKITQRQVKERAWGNQGEKVERGGGTGIPSKDFDLCFTRHITCVFSFAPYTLTMEKKSAHILTIKRMRPR